MLYELNKDYILDKVSQEDIFSFYFNEQIELGIFYCNPLRVDNHPDCQFYYSPKGVLRLNDFAWGKKFDFIDFVKYRFKIKSYTDALIKVYVDMELYKDEYIKLDSSSIRSFSLLAQQTYKIPRIFKVKRKNVTKTDLDFWHKYLSWINSNHLEVHRIYSLDTLWIDDVIVYEHTKREVAFVYHLRKGNNFQCYIPVCNRLTTKFFLNDNSIIVGKAFIDYTKDYLIITKSYKDWFLMKLMGLNVVAILSETLYDFPIEIISKFNYVFTLFDNDKTGKHCSIIYRRRYNTIPLLFSKDYKKDYSDNLEVLGEETMKKLHIQMANKYGVNI